MMSSGVHPEDGRGRVETCLLGSTHDSALSPDLQTSRPVAAVTDGTAGAAVLDMGAEAFAVAGGIIAAPLPSTTHELEGQMGTYFLVDTPVAELKPGDWVMEPTHGGRRITTIKRYINSSYITFDEGPSNWYLCVETLPCERLS